jgi:predicted DNA-binding transcriptional regulator AlpA
MPSGQPSDSISTTVVNHQIAATESEHLTLDETAEWLRCSTRTLQRLLETGSGPPAIRLSERRLIFRLADLRSWVAGRTTGSATETAPRRRGRLRK